MLYKLRQRATDESGFTLIELLVVVLIIGILAAIAIPSFLSQREKAQDAEAKTDARTAQTAMETYFTNESNYNTNVAGLQKIEKSLTGSKLTAASGGADTFTVTATSKNGTDFIVSRAASGAVTRTCGPPAKKGEGACPNSGSW